MSTQQGDAARPIQDVLQLGQTLRRARRQLGRVLQRMSQDRPKTPPSLLKKDGIALHPESALLQRLARFLFENLDQAATANKMPVILMFPVIQSRPEVGAVKVGIDVVEPELGDAQQLIAESQCPPRRHLLLRSAH